jgi:hypothetical protein
MIHIATVHHFSDKWIDIQLKYIETYLKRPYKIYAFLNGIEKDYSQKFYFTSKKNIGSHADKLNFLAKIICEKADDSDLIIFIDGDAFPINNLDSFLNDKLQNHKLLAIKRIIDFGDCQPHPSFCATTVGFWKEINGNWNEGFSWLNSKNQKQTTDVGGNLLKKLIEKNIEWYAMLRSNKTNIHEQWFGVYENLIYHHGAGFRAPLSKIDRQELRDNFTFLEKTLSKIIFFRRFLYLKKISENQELSEKIYKMIVSDFDCFFK